MKIIIRPDAEAAATLAGDVIASEVRVRPNQVLGLATGRTMESVYTRLSEIHWKQHIDFSNLITFNLDEYVGLPENDDRSYRRYMESHLFSNIGLTPDRTHIPAGYADDPFAEARSYELAIEQAGGVDLQLLGIGENGHIGFNEPLSGIETCSRVVTLTEATRRQNAEMFEGDPEKVPQLAITMGIGTILKARSILLVATGVAKAEAIANAIEGPLRASLPASALQLHSHCIFILDEAAAQNLVLRKEIDYQTQHDPRLAGLLNHSFNDAFT